MKFARLLLRVHPTVRVIVIQIVLLATVAAAVLALPAAQGLGLLLPEQRTAAIVLVSAAIIGVATAIGLARGQRRGRAFGPAPRVSASRESGQALSDPHDTGLAALLDLSHRAHELSESGVCELALQTAARSTGSTMAALHAVADDHSLSLVCILDESPGTLADLHAPFFSGQAQEGVCAKHRPVFQRASASRPAALLVPAVDGQRVHFVLSLARTAENYGSADLLHVELVLSALLKIVLRKRAESSLNDLLEMAQDGIYIYDATGNIAYMNQSALRQTGYAPNEILGSNVERLVRPPDRPRLNEYLSALTAEENPLTEWQLLRQDGTTLPLEISSRRIPDGRFITIARDISDRRAAEEKIRQAARIFESTAEGVLVTDAAERIQAVNAAFVRITGFTENEVLGQTPRILKSGRQDPAFYRRMWQQLHSEGKWSGEVWNRRRDGRAYPEWLTISEIRNDAGELTNYVATFSDISELKASELQLDYMAHHDLLTGLSNRTLFRARLEHSIERATRDGSRLAVLFIDLDHFKKVNDTMGHSVGDRLLTAVAHRMQAHLRRVDTLARLGGDEFILFLEEIDSGRDAAIVAEKMLALFETPISTGNGTDFSISASIGISLFPDDGTDVETLIKNADAAMYEAKNAGRNACRYYTAEMTNLVFQNMVIENALRHAVKQDELVLWYQPQFDLRTGELIGVEALLRWMHPELGLLSPNRFISIAENSGLIHPIGEWVLFRVCRQMREWTDAGFLVPRVAINVSMQQFERGSLGELVRAALAESDISADRLEIELTESVLMSDTKYALEVLDDLHRIGVHLAIDDFGTGYSSLSYLQQMPLQRLKIDRSFIERLDESSAAIVKAIIALAQSLGLRAIAEGVERPEQMEFLRDACCTEVQGYLFGRPAPAVEMQQALPAIL